MEINISEINAALIGTYGEQMGPSDWSTANTTCADLGMRLLTIESPEEETHVAQNLSLSNEYVCWVFFNLNIPNSFHWMKKSN